MRSAPLPSPVTSLAAVGASVSAHARLVAALLLVSAAPAAGSSPPSALGRGRVLVGIEMMRFTIDDRADAWNDTFTHQDGEHPLGSTLEFPARRLAAPRASRAR